MQTLLPLVTFALVAGVTPGPNNTLLMISGANWGWKATFPLFLGIVFGFPLMVFAIGMGLGRAFEAWPFLHTVLKIVGCAYLLVLAVKVARAGSPGKGSGGADRPLGFPAAAALQWVNPKGWMMAVTATSVYVPLGAPALGGVLRVVAVFFLAAIPCSAVWCFFGTTVSRFLDTGRRVRVFNAVMAVLLALSLLPMLL